jgi:hypothetical protein
MANRRGFIQQGLVAGGVLGLSGLPTEETLAEGERSMNIGMVKF